MRFSQNAIRSGVKTAVKKVRVAFEAGDKEAAAALLNATSVIDRARSKGVRPTGWGDG